MTTTNDLHDESIDLTVAPDFQMFDEDRPQAIPEANQVEGEPIRSSLLILVAGKVIDETESDQMPHEHLQELIAIAYEDEDSLLETVMMVSHADGRPMAILTYRADSEERLPLLVVTFTNGAPTEHYRYVDAEPVYRVERID